MLIKRKKKIPNTGKHRLVDTTYIIREPVLINLIPINRILPVFPITSLKLLSYNYKRPHQDKLYQKPDEENVSLNFYYCFLGVYATKHTLLCEYKIQKFDKID